VSRIEPAVVFRAAKGTLNAFVLRDAQADLNALAVQLADFEWNGIRPDGQE
jgi:hypothetical protein